MNRSFLRILLAGFVLTLVLGCSSQATGLKNYFTESDPLLDALVNRFDEPALRAEALRQELYETPNDHPFIAPFLTKARAMAEEMARAKADVEIVRRQIEALRVPQEGQAYHNRVLAWVRVMEDYLSAENKIYGSSVILTENPDPRDRAAYSLQERQARELRAQVKEGAYRIDQGRRELAQQFGLPVPAVAEVVPLRTHD